ncbi:cupin domain-containing protein [Williamsia sterculiae]|uniref:Cupin superfamily protein n=1 Tax=Williamsia sterculiae TaxID=1344003 RepID=A0A1N7G7K0_9NOCA|nr:cupin domain-containing protein [Williamsia sterculiae]SIS08569.1 Cupin superfamily protein [Williamsia sterculiae]
MLSRCVALSVDEFARDHWGRSPLLSTADVLPRDFVDLLSPDAVDELIAERGVRTPFIRMAREGSLLDRSCFTGSAGFGAEMPDQVDSAKVLAEFAAGATIVLQGLHRLWPPVIDFVRGMVDDVGHPAQTNAYITPPSNRGFDPHYDVHDVFVLQVSGSKHWTVHSPVHTDPLAGQPWTDHREAIAARVRDTPVIDTVLRPGDALYLPRGWIHSAQALGDTSIHLTVGVAPLTRYDVVRNLLDELAGTDALRASLPMGLDFTRTDDVVAESDKTLSMVIAALQDAPPELVAAASAALGTTFTTRTRPIAVRPLRSLDLLTGLAVDTRLQLRHGLIARVAGAHLHLTDRTIAFPAQCADAIAAVVTGGLVSADSLPGLDSADSLVVLRRLIREGVVVEGTSDDG